MIMKKWIKFPVLLSLMGGLALGVAGCGKVEDGLNSITWELNFDLVKTTWDIQFINAVTGELIGANSEEKVEVSLSGPDRESILDLAGKKRSSFYSSKGSLALALHPDHTSPENGKPVMFRLHASHGDFIPAVVPVITHHDGISPLKVYLTPLGESPENASVRQLLQTSMVTNGRIESGLEVLTPGNTGRILILSGTEMVTSSGEQLGGTLDVTLGHWPGGENNALASLPGGQLALDEPDRPGQIDLAGALDLEVRDQFGKAAAYFDKPAEAQILVNGSVYNPVTRTAVSANDMIPVWHLDRLTGTWALQASVMPEAFQGNFTLTFQVTKPGLWMAGWIDTNLCNRPVSITFNTLPEYNSLPYAFTLNLFRIRDDEFRFLRKMEIGGLAGDTAWIPNLPSGEEIYIRFEPYMTGVDSYYKAPDPLLLTGFCEAGYGVSSDLLPKPGCTFKKIKVVFIDTQHNQTRYNPLIFPGYYRKTGTTAWQSAFVYNGEAFMVNPDEGSVYEMGMNFKGEFHRKEVLVGSEELVVVEIGIE
jgi:hypothetical protein